MENLVSSSSAAAAGSGGGGWIIEMLVDFGLNFGNEFLIGLFRIFIAFVVVCAVAAAAVR